MVQYQKGDFYSHFTVLYLIHQSEKVKQMKIDDLKKAIQCGITVEFSNHCQKRMLERNISAEDIIYCIKSGEIIEEYPLDNECGDKSLASCLVLGYRIIDNKAIHIVVGFNGTRLLIISACYPDEKKWLNHRIRRN